MVVNRGVRYISCILWYLLIIRRIAILTKELHVSRIFSVSYSYVTHPEVGRRRPSDERAKSEAVLSVGIMRAQVALRIEEADVIIGRRSDKSSIIMWFMVQLRFAGTSLSRFLWWFSSVFHRLNDIFMNVVVANMIC